MPMSSYIFTLFFISLKILSELPASHSLQRLVLHSQETLHPNNPSPNRDGCHETRGGLQVNFPFYISNASCGWSDAFELSCMNSTNLFLNINSQNYRVLEIYSDGILVDFPGFSNACRPYNDLNSFGFSSSEYFSVSDDNVIGLYDCEDLSLCKASCESNVLPGCDGNEKSGPSCCYPLNDHSAWSFGDNFSIFSKYECRGFSSWVVPRGSTFGKRGVKLEWALPITRNSSNNNICSANARAVNATALKHGIRCVCNDGFSGDGFAKGNGCLKTCVKDGKEAYGSDCRTKRHNKKKIIILAAVLPSILALISLAALLYFLKHLTKPKDKEAYKTRFKSTSSFCKAFTSKIFTLDELQQATKSFADAQKLLDLYCGSVFSGLLHDGTTIAVQKVHCSTEKDLLQVLSQIELLSSIPHRHMARISGCCIDSGYTPMVVYEFPENGTLEQQLERTEGQQIGLDWYKRLTIAAQTATTLAFLQSEISPPIFHHNLRTGCIFLDQEFSVKVACFELLTPPNLIDNKSTGSSNLRRISDVYDFGVLLLEIISGSKHFDMANIALQKVRDGNLEELVDPLLYYHEQPSFRREQMEIVADVAIRCLLFGGEGKLGMVGVAKELVHIATDSIDGGSKKGPALEETFSNSSLLQMISMSPDSIYVP